MEKRKIKKIGSILISILLVFCFLPYISFGADVNELEISSPSAVVMDAKTGKIFYEKNKDEKRYPASTTKLMTAILVVENSNLEDMAKVSSNAILSVPSGYSSTLLQVGEEMSVEELLYALLVKSSNESANVLAEKVAGNVDSFASMMNTKAVELGCQNTNFVNANGVQNENHYSSASDLAKIAQYGMKNATIRKIVSTVSHTLPSTNLYSRTDRILITTNDLMNSKSKNYYEYAIGIKTGYTKYAGNCLIAGSNKDGVELIAVVLGVENNTKGLSKRDQDCKNLFNFVYDNYTKKVVVPKDATVQTIQVSNADRDTRKLDLLAKEDLSILLSNNGSEQLGEAKVTVNQKIQAPIAKGTTLGTVSYVVEGQTYQIELLASHDVQKMNVPVIIFRIALIVFVLLLIYGLYKKEKKRKKKRGIMKKRKNSKR